MLRLFSSFAHGAPGVGLLLMRATLGVGMLVHAAGAVAPSVSGDTVAFGLASLAAAVLLLAGLWTPLAGVLAALVAAWHGLASAAGPDVDILLGVQGVALALLGPGAWSLDARLFGWKRFEIRNGTTTPPDDDPGEGGDSSH